MRHIARFNRPPRIKTVQTVDSSRYCRGQQNVQKLHLIEIIRRIEVSTEHLSFKSTPFTTFDTSISLWISIFSLGDSIANVVAMVCSFNVAFIIDDVHAN